VPGSGDHPLSEPEIDALIRAIVARPNVCGFNAFHTSGGVLLRPSSTAADATLAPNDVWVWNEFAQRGTDVTGYPAHSVFEDFTWDTTETMSGASDDWAYEHLGIYGWTTEFWDIVHAATGEKISTKAWYTGPTDDEALAVLHWLDGQPGGAQTAGFVDWYPFDHPQLGAVELGGWNDLYSWTNPPLHLLRDEVDGHGAFAVAQALAAPAWTSRTPPSSRWVPIHGACRSALRTPAGSRRTSPTRHARTASFDRSSLKSPAPMHIVMVIVMVMVMVMVMAMSRSSAGRAAPSSVSSPVRWRFASTLATAVHRSARLRPGSCAARPAPNW